MSKFINLVSYSDSDTDSDQDASTGAALARNTDLSTSPIRRDTPHRSIKGDASHFERENYVYPPLKKRRKDEDPVNKSSKDNEHEYTVRVGDARIQTEDEHSTQLMERGSSISETVTLALPSAILDMFKEEGQCEVSAASDNHQGRVRSFAHVRGNWATHVFLAFESTSHVSACINDFFNSIQKHFRVDQFHAVPELHMSLSRTVAVQHHWIEPLMDSMRSKFKQRKCFVVGFRDIAFYTNDDCTRSFVGLDVISGQDQVYSLVKDVDECFSMYRLQQYYKNPSFHVSLYWCLGNILKAVTVSDRRRLQDKWDELLQEHQASISKQDIALEINEVRCRTGNKVYSFPLSFF